MNHYPFNVPLNVQKYERYLPNAFDESLTILEKINKIISYINHLSCSTNDLIDQWNAVMDWIERDGLTDAVNGILTTWLNDGTFQTLFDTLIGMLGDFNSFRPWDSLLFTKMKNEFQERGLNVKWYGAKGDGVTDDGPAILAAHTAANTLGVKVIYPKATYFISNVKNIPVKTSTNFNDSTIIIDDNVNTDDHLYLLTNDTDTIALSASQISSVLPFAKKTSKAFPSLTAFGRCFAFWENSAIKEFIRYGSDADNGIPMQDWTVISKDGAIECPLLKDFSSITAFYLKQIPESQVVFENATFISKGTYASDEWKGRNIQCERSNVQFKNITHHIDQDFVGKMKCLGFIYLYHCADIELNTIHLQPRLYQNGGNYDFGTYKVAHLSIQNLHAMSQNSDLWGVMGGNEMKDTTFDHCAMNRIDSHIGSADLTIKHSTIGNWGLSLIGQGTLTLDHLKIYSNSIVSLREDYGSNWDGDMIIKNIDVYPDTNYFRFINVKNHAGHDFGYRCLLGHNLVHLENIIVHNENVPSSTQSYVYLIQHDSIPSEELAAGNQRYGFAKKFVFKNIQCLGTKCVILGLLDMTQYNQQIEHTVSVINRVEQNEINVLLKTNLTIDVDNVDLFNFGYVDNQTANSFFSSNLNNRYGTGMSYNGWATVTNNYAIVPKISIKNCAYVYASPRAYPMDIIIENTPIYAMDANDNGTHAKLYAKDCLIHAFVKSSNYGTFDGNRNTFLLDRCLILPPTVEDGSDYIPLFKDIYKMFNNTNEDVLYFNVGLINCELSKAISTELIKTNFANYGWTFGTLGGLDSIPKKIGTTSEQPPARKNKLGSLFRNTDTNQTLIYTSTGYVPI